MSLVHLTRKSILEQGTMTIWKILLNRGTDYAIKLVLTHLPLYLIHIFMSITANSVEWCLRYIYTHKKKCRK